MPALEDGERPASAGQVALAWILAQGDDFFVIPGTKKIRVCLAPSLVLDTDPLIRT